LDLGASSGTSFVWQDEKAKATKGDSTNKIGLEQALYSEGVPFSSAGLTLSGVKNTSGTNVLPQIEMFCT